MQIKLPTFLLPNPQWLERKQNSILSAAVIITVANVISSLSGLLRQRLLIGIFFQTQASKQALEALQVAFQIPDLMFQLIILGAISAAFIPVFSSLKKRSEEEAFEMSAIVMNLLLLAFFVVSVIVFIFAKQITIFRTGPEFTANQVEIVTLLTRIMLLAQMFFAVSNFFSGILQSYQKFLIPSIAPIFYNVGIILGVYLFYGQFGIYSAGIGVVLGAFLHMAIQMPSALKHGFRFKFSFNINYPGVKEILKLTPPRLLGLGINELEDLALAFFATSLGNLSFLLITLASTLMTIPIRLFGVPIGQASLPFLSDESESADLTRFKELVVQSLHQISFLSLPASVLLLILRIPIVRIAYGTSDFPWTTTVTTGWAVAMMSTSITAQAMTQLVVRAFYALKNTKTPFWITVVTVAFNIFMYYATVKWTNWGVIGLASGITGAALGELVLLLFFLDRRIHIVTSKAFWFPQLKMLCTSFLMAVFLYLPFKILDEVVFDTSHTIELIGLTITTATIGMLVYLYFSALFEVKELKIITTMLSSFDLRKKVPLQESEEVLMESSIDGDNDDV